MEVQQPAWGQQVYDRVTPFLNRLTTQGARDEQSRRAGIAGQDRDAHGDQGGARPGVLLTRRAARFWRRWPMITLLRLERASPSPGWCMSAPPGHPGAKQARERLRPCATAPGRTCIGSNPSSPNLRHPQDAFVRVDLALVIEGPDEAARTRLGAEIASDTMAYLRTLDLARLEGASGPPIPA